MSRGRGYRGSTRGGGSNYRGSSSSYRGSSRNSGFNSSSYGGGGGGGSGGGSSSRPYGSSNYNSSRSRDRLGSRHDRRDDHKRSYRGSRDRSPERKRSRHDDSRLSSSYSSYRRTESSRSRQTPPPPSVRPTTSSSSYRAHRDGSSHRHSGGGGGGESMGPPKTIPSRSRTTRPRVAGSTGEGGSNGRFRGSSSRGLRVVRRRESSDMRLMRMQLLLARKKDRARRIKIARLTSSLRKRRDVPRKVIRKLRTEKKDESKDDDDEEKKKSKSADVDEENDNEEVEKGEETDNKEGSTVTIKEFKEEKDTNGEGEEAEAVQKETTDEKETEEELNKKANSKSRKKKTFIKLTCVHCRMKCLTFKEYNNHLFSRTHNHAMRRLALRQKAQLSHMRMQQRNAQREIEEKSKEETEDSKPQFCLLCRLNYRQPKAKHQLSEAHRNMRKFLMPYCNICHIAFKSPMQYETHRCSLEHIIRKDRNNESQGSDPSDNEKEVDLNNFMTVDSVGEIDGHNLLADGETEGEGANDVNVGADHVKKTEAFFCELCGLYFPLQEDEEAILKKHCLSRTHLKSFIRYREDRKLRLEAQRKQKESKEKKKGETDEKDKDEENNENENTDNNEPEDKLWADVDKDLGDLLRDVRDDPEDEEEDGSVLNINIKRRFDRFKNSEKQKEVNGTDKDDASEKAVEEEVKEASPVKIKKENESKTTSSKKDETPAEA